MLTLFTDEELWPQKGEGSYPRSHSKQAEGLIFERKFPPTPPPMFLTSFKDEKTAKLIFLFLRQGIKWCVSEVFFFLKRWGGYKYLCTQSGDICRGCFSGD